MEILDSDWYDKKETLERLGVADRTLRTWIQEKRIRVKANPKNHSLRLYNAQDVDGAAREAKPIPSRRPTAPEKGAIVRPIAPKTAQNPDVLAAMKVFVQQQQETLKLMLEQRQIETRPEHAAEFLTLTQSADYLRLPKAYVKRAITEGRLPAIKAGGWKIQRAALQAFTG